MSKMSDYIKPSEYQHLPLGVSVVYSIVDIDDITNLYAGSCKCIRRRIANHISDCYNENRKKFKLKVYQYIRDHGGINRFKFVILEYIEDINSLIEREQFYYDKLRPPLNSQRPKALPKTEYYELNKETINQKHKQYRDQNKEQIIEYQKQYYQLNKERLQQKHTCKICSGFYTKSHKAEHEKSNKHQRALQKNSQSQQ